MHAHVDIVAVKAVAAEFRPHERLAAEVYILSRLGDWPPAELAARFGLTLGQAMHSIKVRGPRLMGQLASTVPDDAKKTLVAASLALR